MSDWQTQFEEMRRQFYPRAVERLVKTLNMLDRLLEKPDDADLLADIYKDVHWLAGAGGTYKIREISEIGRDAEEVCDKYLEEERYLPISEINFLRSLIESAHAILSKLTP
jgi:chemotaxis protein histidine kinase CheA